ncbi:unnamed protein product [Meloidogyne enterolobii]|uniref:Uncharacterized protein n=1 Tax=Meloidogyne enterolobii TaxID=390850 RepID=A0ACB0XWP8_MELEN
MQGVSNPGRIMQKSRKSDVLSMSVSPSFLHHPPIFSFLASKPLLRIWSNNLISNDILLNHPISF